MVPLFTVVSTMDDLTEALMAVAQRICFSLLTLSFRWPWVLPILKPDYVVRKIVRAVRIRQVMRYLLFPFVDISFFFVCVFSTQLYGLSRSVSPYAISPEDARVRLPALCLSHTHAHTHTQSHPTH